MEPKLSLNIVPINDAFGPSIVDAGLTAIIASKETMKGAAAVNAERFKRGLGQLDTYIIDLTEEKWEAGTEGVGEIEAKVPFNLSMKEE